MASDGFKEQFNLNQNVIAAFAGLVPMPKISVIHLKEEPLVKCDVCGDEVKEIEILRNAGCCDACTRLVE